MDEAGGGWMLAVWVGGAFGERLAATPCGR